MGAWLLMREALEMGARLDPNGQNIMEEQMYGGTEEKR